MKAMVFTAPSVVEMQDVPEPSVGAGEVLVHVEASGICGSELHGIRKPGFRVPPLVMGHEFAGTTDDGRPVVVNPILSCGHCDTCLRGLRHVCREREIIGIHRPGGFAERVAVPETALTPLPAEVDWRSAASIEPAANAVHAWALAGRPSGARVAIMGAGPIGLFCLLVALNGGAARVDVVDRSPDRLEVATRLGASAVSTELVDEYDVTFEAVGVAATREQAVSHVVPGGLSVWIGLADAAATVDAAALIRTEKRVLGSFAYTNEDFHTALQASPGWDLSWVSSFPLAEGSEVFTGLMNGASAPIKALLHPHSPGV